VALTTAFLEMMAEPAAEEDAALSAAVEKHAAAIVVPYLRAFDVWQRNIDLSDPEEPDLLASRAGVEAVAGGDEGATLQACVAEVERLGKPRSERHQRIRAQWLQVLACLRAAHHRLVLTSPREHPRRGDGGADGMTRGVKYRLYALRNLAPEMRPFRSYWLSASRIGETEASVDDSRWNAVEGLPSTSSSTAADGGGVDTVTPGSRGPAAAVTDVLHRHAKQAHGPPRRWSLYIPARCQHADCSASSVPLVLALHGARTLCDQHLLSWLPTARAHGFAVLSLQSTGRSWGLRGRDQVLPDIFSLLATLETVLASHAALDSSRIFLTGMSDGGARN
jgi:hypothetical protein